MRTLRFVVVLALLIPAWAQTAQVVMLSQDDHAKVVAAYAKLRIAEAEVAAVRGEIEKKYLQVPESSPDRGNCYAFNGATWANRSNITFTASCQEDYKNCSCPKGWTVTRTAITNGTAIGCEEDKTKIPNYWRTGFGCGGESWEFSRDFRFIVPKPSPVIVQQSPLNWIH